MKTPANDRGSDGPAALPDDPAVVQLVEPGDDTREIPLAAMQQMLDS